MKQPLKLTTRQGERIAVVAGLRTPFAKQATAFHGVPAVDLGKLVVSELLARALAEGAKAAGIEKVAFDRSGFAYHGRVKALADAAREAGLQF